MMKMDLMQDYLINFNNNFKNKKNEKLVNFNNDEK